MRQRERRGGALVRILEGNIKELVQAQLATPTFVAKGASGAVFQGISDDSLFESTTGNTGAMFVVKVISIDTHPARLADGSTTKNLGQAQCKDEIFTQKNIHLKLLKKFNASFVPMPILYVTGILNELFPGIASLYDEGSRGDKVFCIVMETYANARPLAADPREEYLAMARREVRMLRGIGYINPDDHLDNFLIVDVLGKPGVVMIDMGNAKPAAYLETAVTKPKSMFDAPRFGAVVSQLPMGELAPTETVVDLFRVHEDDMEFCRDIRRVRAPKERTAKRQKC